ncbi:Lrp/AsnC family transcriptional regulator [Chitinimonas sp. BJB300]|uniref:Lrp/AsnC family transcriptional regulator n=1 Tax=Chitinimonas sp. BJB300 TaxID=1559339 RepID=UPI000C121475|nr:Lrp/AsnC family transcriptional regulator [Chitinimonas sp. BJB300]PHV10668.1 ArsR family transcriptional regulator [Chitinimonas sp. BJB300]TSJ84490.1 Lrp/AsnC family transcriptional regulator [Chitinimonas sp. BJB300]
MTDLDKVDIKILDALQKDGRLSNLELADAINLSPSPTLRRLKRLEQEGVIARYVALLEPAKVGLGLEAFVRVMLDKRERQFATFAVAVQAWPEVVACHAMAGEMDYLLRVVFEDLAHFSRFVMDTLLQHPGVLDVKSSFVLQAIKQTTALPLAHLGSNKV